MLIFKSYPYSSLIFLFQEIAKHLLAQTGGNLELALDHVNARLGGDMVNGGLAPSSGFGVQQHPVVVRKSSQVGSSMLASTRHEYQFSCVKINTVETKVETGYKVPVESDLICRFT